MKIDVELLTQAIAEDAPSGEDLSYDPAYLELEKLTKGTAETQFSEGEEPDWKAVHRSGVELLGRTKDLRVLIYLALAALQTDGFPDSRSAVALLKSTIEDFWDSFHPQLDPDDDNDPLERMNILASLSPPPGSYSDPLKFEDKIMRAPLTMSTQVGNFSLRDILVAQDVIKPAEGTGGEEGSKLPDMALIGAGFQDTSTEDLAAIHEGLKGAADDLESIDQFTTEKVGAGAAVNLNGVVKMLRQASERTAEQLLGRGYGLEEEAAEGEGEGGEEAGGGEGGGEGKAAGAGERISGEIRSIQDVLSAMQKIETYYKKVEPSSPVPLIMGRAKKLVGRSFIEILEDLSPAAISQVETVSGKSAAELAQESAEPGGEAEAAV